MLKLTTEEIEDMVANTVATMAMEGFELTAEETDILRKIAGGEITAEDRIQYLRNSYQVRL